MALNIQTFKTRALTALLFVAVMLTGLLWNFQSFFILFAVIHFGCWVEYLKLVEKIYATKIDAVIKWLFFICGFTLVVVLGLQHQWTNAYLKINNFEINLKWCFWAFEILCLFIVLTQNKQIPQKAKRMSFAGLFYISLSIALFVNLRDAIFLTNEAVEMLEAGKVYVCAVMFSIWINDTMAYLVGSFIGKTPLSKISPKKTWEGTIGGIILCVLIMGLLYPLVVAGVADPAIKPVTWFIIPAICAIFGTLGDLLESKIKRMADVKDSGSFMPGHGGFLDRFDSLLVAVPFVWLFVKILL